MISFLGVFSLLLLHMWCCNVGWICVRFSMVKPIWRTDVWYNWADGHPAVSTIRVWSTDCSPATLQTWGADIFSSIDRPIIWNPSSRLKRRLRRLEMSPSFFNYCSAGCRWFHLGRILPPRHAPPSLPSTLLLPPLPSPPPSPAILWPVPVSEVFGEMF